MAQSTPLINSKSSRIIELDYLRVLAFGLLIFYHIGMLYTEGWGWHYKSSYSSEFLANIMLWSNQWRMSLLFLISGAAVSLMLTKQSPWRFIRKRTPILLLPLIFGMLVIVVPQVYVEANSTGVIVCPNFWHFWYIYLDQYSVEFADHKTIGTMHLTWNHLWFLPYLLVYSLIMAGLYPFLSSSRLKPLWDSFQQRMSIPLIILLPIIGLYLIGFFLYDNHPVTHNFVDDWFNQARSFFCFLIGFALIRMTGLWKQLFTLRWLLLISATLTFCYCLFSFHGGSLGESWIAEEFNSLIWNSNTWLWIVCIISWAQYCFTSSNNLVNYLNKGIFCFYVLHQTLIIVIAYFLVPLRLGAAVEPILIILLVPISCVLLYEFIRRIPFVGILFGVSKEVSKIKL